MQNRRELLSTVGGVAVVGLAGCTGDGSEPESESSPSENPTNVSEGETDEEQDADREEGLQVDFTWDDVDEAEIEAFENREYIHGLAGGTSARRNVDSTYFRNSDLTNKQEFQEAFSNTVYDLVEEELGRKTSQDSSALVSGALAGVNLVLLQELQNNPDYTDFDAKIIPYVDNGHGRGYVASTHHRLTLVDSNTRNAGTIDEEPLKNRNDNINDILAEFQDTNFDEIEDRTTRAKYHGFPGRIYSMNGEFQEEVGFDSSIIDEVYDQAVFAKDGETFMTSVRDAVAALEFMRGNGYFEDYAGISLTSTPDMLPERTKYNEFQRYVNELVTNHVIRFDTEQEFAQSVLHPN